MNELIGLKERRNELKTRLYMLQQKRRGLDEQIRCLALEMAVTCNKLRDVEIDIATEETEGN